MSGPVLAGVLAAVALVAAAIALMLAYAIEKKRFPDLKPRGADKVLAAAFGPAAGDAKVARLRNGVIVALLAAAALLLGALASLAPHSEPTYPDDPAAAELQPPRLPPEATLIYTRAAQDGSLPQTVLVHIVSETELSVASLPERCMPAQLTTITIDRRTREPKEIVRGLLTREGEQEKQTFLTFNARTRALELRNGQPRGEPAQTLTGLPEKWVLYDLDFAEFALNNPGAPAPTLSFGVVTASRESGAPVLRAIGQAEATLLDSGIRAGEPFAMYALAGDAFAGNDGGMIWLDPDTGHMLEARLGKPNQTGADDYNLKLDELTIGKEDYRERLLAHWRDCP